jgi:hypothetical protein
MQIKNRNRVFSDATAIIWEGSHAMLYRTGTDSFGKPLYNIAILKYTSWIVKPELYWFDYSTGHGAYGNMGGLVTMAEEANRQAKLTHESFYGNPGGIENLIRVAREEKINWHMIYDISGYYAIVETGYFVGPNKHTGTIA